MRPSIALIENVDALLRRGLDVVLADLRSIGYHLEWDIIPAAAVGAPHLRQRFFGVARPAELAGDPVYGDVLYDRHGERVTFEITGKLPRAGRMGAENVALEPIAPRKTKRHDGWSHWVGVDLLGVGKSFLLPSPTATMGERGGRGDLLQVVRGNQSPSGHFASGRLWPTLHGVAREDYSRPQGPSGNELGRAINRSLWPTPSAASGEQGPGNSGREGGDNLVTRVARHQRGSLSPTWTEHIMAIPLYWTDPDFSNELVVPVPWWFEPPGVPRVEVGVRYRADRLRAIGNSVVWPCAYVALDRALAATPLRSVAFAA